MAMSLFSNIISCYFSGDPPPSSRKAMGFNLGLLGNFRGFSVIVSVMILRGGNKFFAGFMSVDISAYLFRFTGLGLWLRRFPVQLSAYELYR